MTAIQTASIESEIQTFSRDYYIQLSTAAAECGSNFLPNIIVSNEKIFQISTLGCLPILKNIFEQNGERHNESIQPKDLKSKISEDLAQK